MKSAYSLLALPLALVCLYSCSSQSRTSVSGTDNSSTSKEKVIVSDIVLQDKSLPVIKEHVSNIKWKLLYRTGGLTGSDKTMFEDTYLTFTKDKIVRITDGEVTHQPFKWERQRDIYTGDSTWVISGDAQWKVEGIYNDTLRLADNFYDGYGYALVRAK